MKVLFVRFSSIGDIVLTSPVIRLLHITFPEAEIHFLTKKSYQNLLVHHPLIHTIHLLGEEFNTVIAQLKAEQFDHVIDLHNNLRSWRVKMALRCPSSTLDKQNFQKYQLTRLKRTSIVIPHIVDRYCETLQPLGIETAPGPLEFYYPPELDAAAQRILEEEGFELKSKPLLAVALGGSHFTKRWLPKYFITLLNELKHPVILLGGNDVKVAAQEIERQLEVPLFSAIGKYDLLTATALMKQATAVLTHDTGMMHIAAALQMQVFVLWGNTVPELGMYPHQTPHVNLETKGLGCRPCSKIGYDRCPRGHFDCMQQLTPEKVLPVLGEYLG